MVRIKDCSIELTTFTKVRKHSKILDERLEYFATIIQRIFRNREQCAICYEMVQCGNKQACHNFHTSCINSWIMTGNMTCPVCRRLYLISPIKKMKIIESALCKMKGLRKIIEDFDTNYFDIEEEVNWKRKINLGEYFIESLSNYANEDYTIRRITSANLNKLDMYIGNLKTYIEELQEIIQDYYIDVNEDSILHPSYVENVRNILVYTQT